MNIADLDKAEVLSALYNGSRQQGLGFLQPIGASNLSVEEARSILEKQSYFDYLYGRVMKVDLKNDEVDTFLYNRDNGENSAENIVDGLRKKSE